MDTEIVVAIIAAGSLIASGWLTRPSRRTHKAVREIRDEFRPNGGGSAKDSLNRIEQSVAHLAGRFEQHVSESDKDKELSHREAIRMWAAIEATAKAKPPTE